MNDCQILIQETIHAAMKIKISLLIEYLLELYFYIGKHEYESKHVIKYAGRHVGPLENI